jgi:hypothetical protein
LILVEIPQIYFVLFFEVIPNAKHGQTEKLSRGQCRCGARAAQPRWCMARTPATPAAHDAALNTKPRINPRQNGKGEASDWGGAAIRTVGAFMARFLATGVMNRSITLAMKSGKPPKLLFVSTSTDESVPLVPFALRA